MDLVLVWLKILRPTIGLCERLTRPYGNLEAATSECDSGSENRTVESVVLCERFEEDEMSYRDDRMVELMNDNLRYDNCIWFDVKNWNYSPRKTTFVEFIETAIIIRGPLDFVKEREKKSIFFFALHWKEHAYRCEAICGKTRRDGAKKKNNNK